MGFIETMRAKGHAVELIYRVLREQGCQIAARTYRSWKQTVSTPGEIDPLLLGGFHCQSPASTPRTDQPLSCDRYSVGLTPWIRRNWREKYSGSGYPTSCAIELMVRSVVSSCSRAKPIRRRVWYSRAP